MKKRTLVNEVKVAEFLRNYHTQKVFDLNILSDGNHSEAFSYNTVIADYIVRFNEKQEGFLKDEYAHNNFFIENIVICKIHSNGIYKDGIYYSISEKISGETIREQYNRNDFSSLPAQFQMIENLTKVRLGKGKGFGEWGRDGKANYSSGVEHVQALYGSNDYFDWTKLSKVDFFDKNFVDYLVKRISHYLQFLDTKGVLMHGDIDKNVFMSGGTVSGIIDWEKSRYGDHFLDIGRVVLFCPNREATVSAVLSFYKDKVYRNYKERILLGVYFAMLSNYAFAIIAGNMVSCASYPSKIEQIENLIRK